MSPAAEILSARIAIKPHDSVWAGLVEKEAASFMSALGDNCIAVHHVGSSAVPGLGTKPILDIVVVSKNLATFNPDALVKLGYSFFGEAWLPLMRFFLKESGELCYKIHVFQEGNPEIMLLLSFRNYLRANSKARAEYEALKRGLAEKHAGSIGDYTKGKDAFVADVGCLLGIDVPRIGFASLPERKAAVGERLGAAKAEVINEFVLANSKRIFAVARLTGGIDKAVLEVSSGEAYSSSSLKDLVCLWAQLSDVKIVS